MFKKEPIIFMTGLGVVGYAVFHGHPLGKDCWMCQYRGLVFMSASVVLGVWLAFQESE